jgi:hypothetical protein
MDNPEKIIRPPFAASMSAEHALSLLREKRARRIGRSAFLSEINLQCVVAAEISLLLSPLRK